MSKPHIWRSAEVPGMWCACLATKYREGKVPIPPGRELRPCLGTAGTIGYGLTPAAAVASAAGMRYAIYKGVL